MKLTDKQIEKFINKMHKKYPLDVDVKVFYTLHHGVIIRGDLKLHGTVCCKAGSDEVYADINTDQSDMLVLKTIAHEYRHVMQWMNPDMKWIMLSDNRKEPETDAHLFGNRLVREHYKFPKHV